MPSIVSTIDCDIDYMVVVGFDKGDVFYDTPEGQGEVRQWFEENMASPLAKAGISVSFVLVEVENTKQKPGPVFNAMLREAYHAGADYFYRLNDDSELTHSKKDPNKRWPKVFINALNSFQPPYGVVGPWGGLDRILTHDFVHRTHLDIFKGVYYPAQLVDWYMDDWVSHVYGKSRTIKSSEFEVVHHTTHHGQRYQVRSDAEQSTEGWSESTACAIFLHFSSSLRSLQVNRGNERLLHPLIKKGRELIANYAEERSWESKSNIINDADTPFRDLPPL